MNLKTLIIGKPAVKKQAYQTAVVPMAKKTDEEHFHTLMTGVNKILREVDEVKREVDAVKQEQDSHKKEINNLKVERIGARMTHHEAPQTRQDAPRIDFSQEKAVEPQRRQEEKPKQFEDWLDEVIPQLHPYHPQEAQPVTPQFSNLEQKLSTFGYKGKTPAEVSENWWADEKAKLLGTHESTSIYDEDLNYSAIMDANVLQLVLTARDAITKGDIETTEKTVRRLYDSLRLYVSFDMNAEEERRKWVRYREEKIRELEEKIEQQNDVIYGRGGVPTDEDEPAEVAKKETKKPIAALDGRLGGGFKERPLRERKVVSESDMRVKAQLAIDEFKMKCSRTPPECHYLGDGRLFRSHALSFCKRNKIADYVLTDIKTTLSDGTEISSEGYIQNAWDTTFSDERIKFNTPDAKKFRKLYESERKGTAKLAPSQEQSEDEEMPSEEVNEENEDAENSQI